MTTPDIQQAREWANKIYAQSPECQATVKIIQSLPDQWIDAEKLQEVVSKYEGNTYISAIVQDFADLLPAPPLQTLADMTPEEREACQWTQAETWHEVGIIVWVNEMTEIAQLITRANGVLERKFKDVTPLPDEPKLEWPGSPPSISDESKPLSVETEDVTEVPKPGQAWLVEWRGKEHEALIVDHSHYPWVLHDPKEVDLYSWCAHDEVTPVGRLTANIKENA